MLNPGGGGGWVTKKYHTLFLLVKSRSQAIFLGIAKTLLEEALEVQMAREAELAGEEEKDKVLADTMYHTNIDLDPIDGLDAAQQLEAAEQTSAFLDDCFELQERIAEMTSRKKKDTAALTKMQLQAVGKAGCDLNTHLVQRASAWLLRSSCRGLSLFASALEHDGYFKTASGETAGSGKAAAESNSVPGEMAGSAQAAVESNAASGETTDTALTKEHLEEALMPTRLYEHKLWATLRKEFAEWDAQAPSAIQIMCAVLGDTKAWTVFDQVPPNLEIDEVALVGPAFVNLGVDPDFIAEAWQKKVVDKYIKMSEEATAKIRQPLQHMIEESMKGAFAMSEETVNKALSSAPGKKELKRHLHKYFGCVRNVRGIQSSGSLSKPTDIDEALDGLNACKKEATAFGQELADVGAITDIVSVPRIVEHVDAMILKLSTLKQGNDAANQNALKKINEEAMKLVAKVDVRTEKQFKEDMKKLGNKMAAGQSKLKGVIKLVKGENPGKFDAASGQTATASGQDALESIYAASLHTEATMTEYTCVYVAMTLSKNPKLLMANQLGAGVRASLGSALATLTKCRKTNIFKKEVDEIQATLDTVVEDK